MKARLVDGRVVVDDGDAVRRLLEDGYGVVEDDSLVLEPVEATYLAYIGDVVVYDNNSPLSFDDLVAKLHEHDKNLWIKFTVYHDLRSRGRVVKPGPTPNSLLLYPSKKAKASELMVFIVEETKSMRLDELAAWVEIARKNDKEAVLAVVDKHGDVTYYEVNLIEPVKRVG